MKRILLALLAIACSAASAADTPASEASIKELLTVADTRKIVDGMLGQIEGFTKAAMQKALGGRTLSPEEQQTADKMSSKMTAAMREELSWEKLEPLYIKIYQQSFTQEELDGILAFYKSPAGAALIKKMPVVMQNSMAAMQERMGPMMEKIQKAAVETAAEIDAKKSPR